MSETQGDVRVRSVRTQRSDSFVESAVEFGGGVLRMGLSVATLPFALLPSESRQHLRNATKEVMYAFAGLPGDLAKVASTAVEDWAAKTDGAAKTAPKDELTTS
ncbi:hypothetical protein K2Z83_24325 [Oscillochloris sp. ZM17-4]|uniref:hypothetical protein n=1 Tax=Oscillochloris sp. ZM17-4 TaxID=2866714 RepID=UPI001C7341B6|nr:hypothetical protein [Oscillochloris sp. ZM17-4]MBX0330788.1 hypothetical protein [Oscillochloris sp. ZM17-4]